MNFYKYLKGPSYFSTMWYSQNSFLLASKEVLSESQLQYIDMPCWDSYKISVSVNI